MEYNLSGLLKSSDIKQLVVIGDDSTMQKLRNTHIKGNGPVYGDIFYVKCNGHMVPPHFDNKKINIRARAKKYSFKNLNSFKTGWYFQLLSIELF